MPPGRDPIPIPLPRTSPARCPSSGWTCRPLQSARTFSATGCAAAPSGGGFQLSLLGLLGVLASGVEGFEVNVLGLAFGIDPFSPALRLPLVGRLGAAPSNGSGIPAGITAGRS